MRYARSEYPTYDITSQAHLSPTRKSRQAPGASPPQPARAEECSPPPRHLNAYAKEEWQHIAAELHRLNLLTVLDVGPLAAYCCAAAQLRQGAIERMAKQDRRGHALTIEGNAGQSSHESTAAYRVGNGRHAAHRLGIRAYAKRTTPSFRGQAAATAVEVNGLLG
jgi:P27 family predicted phage terminase small subunit